MFGDALLVAPVYADLHSMEIYLPQGSDWIDYWNHQIYPGGAQIDYDTSDAEKLPLSVRRGSIVPLRAEANWIDPKLPDDPLYLDIYPSNAETEFSLYEDDGETTAYQSGSFAITKLRLGTEPAGDVIVEIREARGEYSGKIISRTYLVNVQLVSYTPLAVSLNKAPLEQVGKLANLNGAAQGWIYDAVQQVVRMKFTASTSANATLRLAQARDPDLAL
jgi:alpha-glucosidase